MVFDILSYKHTHMVLFPPPLPLCPTSFHTVSQASISSLFTHSRFPLPRCLSVVPQSQVSMFCFVLFFFPDSLLLLKLASLQASFKIKISRLLLLPKRPLTAIPLNAAFVRLVTQGWMLGGKFIRAVGFKERKNSFFISFFYFLKLEYHGQKSIEAQNNYAPV